MSLKNIKFRKLLLEFLSISFAVLLALLVRQWREDYNNNKQATQAIQNIKIEFVENNEVISELVINHKLILTQLDSIAKLDFEDESVNDITQSIDFTLINASAWEMAKATDAVMYIDFENISNIAKVYSFQSYYQNLVNQYILSNSIVYENNKDIDELENTHHFLNTIIPIEESLQEYYNLILNEILNK